MSRCIDCWYFTNAAPAGRNPIPCEAVEDPQNDACENFRVRSSHPEDAPLLRHQTENDPLVRAFEKLWRDQQAIEHAATTAIEARKETLQREGIQAGLDDRVFSRYMDRLADLALLKGIVGVLGFENHQDAILAAEITRMFGPAPQKELNARLHVLPNQLPGTNVGGPDLDSPPTPELRDLPPVDRTIKSS